MSWHRHGRYVQVLGRRMHLVDVGSGPAVLLQHGFLHSCYTWRGNLAALARRYRVLAPDLPGYGWSERGPGDYSFSGQSRALEALLDALEVDQLHAGIGNSLGGGVLAELALRRPRRVERLVLVNSVGWRLPVPRAVALLGHRLLDPLFRATAANPRFQRHALSFLAYRRRGADADVLRGFAPLAEPGSQQTATESAAAFHRGTRELRRRLPELHQPTLLVWGRRDRIFPLRHARGIAGRLPDARLEVFPDCGHCPHEEDPSRFNARVAAFLGPDGG